MALYLQKRVSRVYGCKLSIEQSDLNDTNLRMLNSSISLKAGARVKEHIIKAREKTEGENSDTESIIFEKIQIINISFDKKL